MGPSKDYGSLLGAKKPLEGSEQRTDMISIFF